MNDGSNTPEAEEVAAPGPARLSIGRLLLFVAPFGVFVAIGVVLGLRLLQPPSAGEFESRPAPPLDVATLYSDERLTTDRLIGADDVVIVNFWFSNCPPCVLEHPTLIALSEMEGVTVFGVAVERDPNLSRAFLERYGNPFELAGFDDRRISTVEWGVRLFPETYVLSSDGEIVYRHAEGAILPHQIDTVLMPAIEEARRR